MPLLFLAMLTGASGSPAHDLPLQGTLWTLSQISPRGSELFTPGKALPKPTLKLTGQRLSGSTGCNEFRGAVQLQGDQWRTSRVTSTRVACTDHALSLESDYLELLNGATRYQISDNRLTIFSKGSARLILTGAPLFH